MDVTADELKFRSLASFEPLSTLLYCVRSVADPGGPGGHGPPVGGLKNFFCQYINIITKPTAYDGPWEY